MMEPGRFADGEIIGRVMEDAVLYGACAAGMPSKDTVKLSDDDGFAKMTPDRNKVWMIQTPRDFPIPCLMEAYDKMMSFEGIPGKALPTTPWWWSR